MKVYIVEYYLERYESDNGFVPAPEQKVLGVYTDLTLVNIRNVWARLIDEYHTEFIEPDIEDGIGEMVQSLEGGTSTFYIQLYIYEMESDTLHGL